MNKDVILEVKFNTGLGDFYACLLSMKVCYDELISNGFSVGVRLNYENNWYASPNQYFIIENYFDLSQFGDDVKINYEIGNDYKLLDYVEYAFYIFIKNDLSNFSFIKDKKFYGYSVESITKGNPYPPINIRNNSLVSNRIKQELNKIVNNFGNFKTFHFRYLDSFIPKMEDIENAKKIIHNLTNENESIFISSSSFEISKIQLDDRKVLEFNYEVENVNDRIKRDLLNMCIMSFSDTIYSQSVYWSNYQTYGLIHNIKNKNHEEFIIKI